MDKQQNTQQPVAWVRFCSDGCYEGPIMDSDAHMDDVRRTSGAWVPLYTAPPVPRDVLMAFGEAVQEACAVASIENGGAVPVINIAALADRYASQVQPEPQLISYSPDMATCTLRIGDEQYLFDRHAEHPEPVNQQMLAALNRYDIEVEGKQIYRVGSPDGRYVLFDDVAAIAAEAAQTVGQPIKWQCRRKDWPEWKHWQNISKDAFLHMQTNAEHWQEYEIRQLFASGQQEIQA